MESALQERARLTYSAGAVREVVQTTKSAAQRLRFALAATGLASRVAASARYLQRPGGAAGPAVGDMRVPSQQQDPDVSGA